MSTVDIRVLLVGRKSGGWVFNTPDSDKLDTFSLEESKDPEDAVEKWVKSQYGLSLIHVAALPWGSKILVAGRVHVNDMDNKKLTGAKRAWRWSSELRGDPRDAVRLAQPLLPRF